MIRTDNIVIILIMLVGLCKRTADFMFHCDKHTVYINPMKLKSRKNKSTRRAG